MSYPPRLDPQCRSLFRVLNSIPGIRTTESCCGHGKRSFRFFFRVEHVRNLYLVARAVDRRYGGPSPVEWNLLVLDSDRNLQVTFMLDSGLNRGALAYRQANKIARNILWTRKMLNTHPWARRLLGRSIGRS